MKATNHPFLLLAVLMFTSCSRHSAVWPQLLEAEQLLETDLPSAGAMIDSLDATSLEGEDAALYAILKTQADWKRYHPLTSDSLPRLATNYYGTPYRKNYHAAMAWYSLGCYYTEQKDDEKAVGTYFNAFHLFPDTLSKYYALTTQNLGAHYLAHNMYSDALENLLRFKSHPLCFTDSSYTGYADYLLGQTYLQMQEPKLAEKYYYAVIENPYASKHFARMSLFQIAKQQLYLEHDTLSALSKLDTFIATGKTPAASYAGYVLKGDIMNSWHMPDSARFYYILSLGYGENIYTQCRAYQQLVNIGSQLGDRLLTDSCFARYEELRDSIFSMSERASLDNAKSEFSLRLLQQKTKSRQNMLLLSLAIILSLVALLILLRKNIKLLSKDHYHNNITKSQLADLETRDTPFREEPSPTPNQSKNELEALVKNRRDRMELYRGHFKETKHYHLLMSASVSHDYAARFASVPLPELVGEIESMCRDFILELRQECPELTSKDALLCACIMLKMPTLSIMNLEECTERALITRKSRVRRKLTDCWNLVIFDSMLD